MPVPMVWPPNEVAFMQYRSEYVARPGPGDVNWRLTFREATGGRATLYTRLSMFVDAIFIDRFRSQ